MCVCVCVLEIIEIVNRVVLPVEIEILRRKRRKKKFLANKNRTSKSILLCVYVERDISRVLTRKCDAIEFMPFFYSFLDLIRHRTH